MTRTMRLVPPAVALVLAGGWAAPVGGCRACREAADALVDRSSGSAPAGVSGLTLESTSDGGVLVRYDHADVARGRYLFWSDGWTWAGPKTTLRGASPTVVPFTIDVERLGLHVNGRIEKVSDRELTYTFEIEAKKALSKVTGGGIEFALHDNDALAQRGAKRPRLLAKDRGWVWDLGKGEELRVEFEGPMHDVFFERNRSDRIRAFFVGGDIEPGKWTVRMRVVLPAGGKVVPSVDQRYGTVDADDWHRHVLAWDTAPIDLSFLNHKPAGKHGRLRAEGDALVFADGTPARFWGTNIAGRTLFSGSHDEVCGQAARLAALGFNLVRLHHHDSRWVGTNIFDTSENSTRKLRDDALEQVDWWVKCLREQGIYVWIDLHVQRGFLAGDGIRAVEELRPQKGEGKGANYVNPDIEARMHEFAAQYLTRKNRYTGLSLAEDPAVVAVLVTNENDFVRHGAGQIFKGGGPEHLKMFEAQAQAFARRTGLPASAVKDVRRPGASKLALNEIEAQFHLRFRDHLRKLGYDGLVVTTNFWGKNPLFALPALTVGDLIDVHAYGEEEFLGANPRYEDNFVSWIGSGQVAGMPLAVSEWNVPYPARDRFAAPLYVASVAALQGWDAPMLYVYLQHNVGPERDPVPWTSAYDPGLMAMMPAAALVFRQGHVRTADKVVRLEPDKDDVYGALSSARRSRAIRTLVELHRLEIGLPDVSELHWDTPRPGAPRAEVVKDLNRSFLAPSATSVRSDTGELQRDWATGIHTIDTPRTQAAAGWIGGRKIVLADVEIEVDPAKAAVAVTSLDGQPIAKSDKLLVTTVARVVARDGKLPYLSEPVPGTIRIRSDAEALVLTPLSGRKGAVGASTVKATRSGRRHTIVLPHQIPTHWYLVTATR